MDLLEAMEKRHSVRAYTDKKITGAIKDELLSCINECNQEGDLNIQLISDEPKAFDSMMAHYGKFKNVKNNIALIGKKGPDLDEKCGYYGEKIVLKAQQLGLNTCWVAMTYKKIKTAFKIGTNEKLVLVIAIGYGTNQGVEHRIKSTDQVVDTMQNQPEWFINGVKAALLAPTAMNQQKFVFSRHDNQVAIKKGTGFYTKVDLGIVKYHFEIGAGKENFNWIKK